MKTIFELKIEMGNDAMKTSDDLAGLLHEVANTLRKPWAFARGGESLRARNGIIVGGYDLICQPEPRKETIKRLNRMKIKGA